MSNDPLAIIIVSNGPGELATWVKPLAKELHKQIALRPKEKKSSIFLTADHGNLEMMFNPKTGKIHTAHTTLPVPLIMESNTNKYKLKSNGKLADIAPTILEFLGISKPKEMTGNSLLISSYE